MDQQQIFNRASVKLIAAAATAIGLSLAGHARASAINVALANYSTSTTTHADTTDNSGIDPITYTPVQVTIPVAPGQTYDAADTADTGTIWNSLQSVNTAPSVASSGVTNVLYEQNIPLADSMGNATTVTLNVSAIEPDTKADYIHTGHNDGKTGADGLTANPASALDGYGTDAGAAHMELMNTAWVANGKSDGMQFTLNGLAPHGNYTLYFYGAGTSLGQGASLTMDAANGGASAATNADTTSEYYSVFGADGITPVPAGESWNVLSFNADANGSATFSALASETTGAIKPSLDGFQIQTAVPEPASLGLLALGALALRRRK